MKLIWPKHKLNTQNQSFRILHSSICKTKDSGTVLHFLTRFCDINNIEELKVDTDSQYLDLAEEKLQECIRHEMRAEWQRLRSNDCVDSFTADAVANFLPIKCCAKHKQYDKREPELFKEELRCTELLRMCSMSVSEQSITLSLPMNVLKKVCPTFTQNE